MDKRYKPLTPQEQLAVRKRLSEQLEQFPSLPIPVVVRLIRTSLRYTINEYAKICDVSPRTLAEVERASKSPTLATVEKLLKPMGMAPGAVPASPKVQKLPA